MLPNPWRHRLAALVLGVAIAVLLLAPIMLDAPNPLALLAAAFVALGCWGAWRGDEAGRRSGLAVSAAGFVVSVLWFLLASDGFGKGAAWLDDMVEALILALAFLIAAVLLWLARPPVPAGRS